MTDNVNSIGVSLDQDELEDPSENVDAPDPLLGEAPRSGALSAIGSKSDQQSRVSGAREAMQNLRSQYGAAAGQATDAYAQQKRALDAATQRLLSMQMGPGEQEAAYMRASVPGEASTGRYDPGAHNAMNAGILRQQREAEIAKQQLLTQYGMQIPQAQLGAANQRLNQITQQMRIQQSDINNASTQADKQARPVNKYFMPDPSNPNGPPVFNQQLYDADMQATKQKADIGAKAKITAQQFAATGLVSPEMVDLAYNDMKSLPSAVLRNPAAMAQILQGVHDRSIQEGDSSKSFWATQQLNKESSKVLDDYSKGKTHTQLDGLNTAVAHINVFKPVVDQLANGNVSVFNTIGNTWNQKVMGKPAPTDFNGVRDFVVGEISKAVLPGGGGERERESLAASAAISNSGPALNSIIQKWQELLAGKTHFAKFNWDNATRGRYGSFESRFLLPETQTALGIMQPAAPVRPGQQTDPVAGWSAKVVNPGKP